MVFMESPMRGFASGFSLYEAFPEKWVRTPDVKERVSRFLKMTGTFQDKSDQSPTAEPQTRAPDQSPTAKVRHPAWLFSIENP